MTDEEKAEEYVNTHPCCYRQDFIQAYLDGLAEGRKEKWHGLRKDPNDLPKVIEICSIPVYIVSEHGNSDLAQYDYKQKLWCYKYSNEHILYNVIAWCELPQFKE